MEVLLAESFLYSKRQRDGFSMCFKGEHVREACRLTQALIEEQNKALVCFVYASPIVGD